MAIPATALDNLGRHRAASAPPTDEPAGTRSAVAWGAIVAGAAAAAALSLILLILGTGLGLSTVSPWANSGMSATGLGLSAIAWLTLTQLIASGAGGYLAGRLRTRWSGVHTDEVYFRDTAHGFLAWAIASLVTASLLAPTVGSIVSGGVQASASTAGGAAGGAATALTSKVAGVTASRTDGNDSGPMGYFVDSLFRRPTPDAVPAAAGASSPSAGVMQNGTAGDPSSLAAPSGASTSSTSGAPATLEVTRIFVNTLGTGSLAPEDVRYVGMLVAQRTGMPQAEAEKRVTDVYTRMQTKLREAEVIAREAADKARKASAYAALWLFISLLAGAFVASLSATFGGRQRDL